MIRVSPTTLDVFTKCPASYKFGLEWKCLLPVATWLTDGTNVHAKLAGEDVELSANAKKYYKQLSDLEKQFDILVVGREMEQVFPISETVELKRIIDVVAWYEDQPLIIDYKTASKPYDKICGKYLKQKSFQTAAYMIDPPCFDPFITSWAKQFWYFVGTPDTHMVITCKHSKALENNFYKTVYLLECAFESNVFPKYYSDSNCKWCQWSKMCWKEKGWESLYKRKENKEK